MDTKIASEHKAGVRSRWQALGVDTDGLWHNLRAHRDRPDEIVVTDPDDGTLVWRECLTGTSVDAWVAHIDAERGWQDHPDADPRRRWFEGAVAA
jgi:hypothetical protein